MVRQAITDRLDVFPLSQSAFLLIQPSSRAWSRHLLSGLLHWMLPIPVIPNVTFQRLVNLSLLMPKQ